jgi:hypothetical protein
MLQHPHNMLQRRTTLSRRLAACRPPGSCRVKSCPPVARRRQLLPPAITPYTARHGTAHAACCMLCCMYGYLARAAAAQQRSRSSRGGGYRSATLQNGRPSANGASCGGSL